MARLLQLPLFPAVSRVVLHLLVSARPTAAARAAAAHWHPSTQLAAPEAAPVPSQLRPLATSCQALYYAVSLLLQNTTFRTAAVRLAMQAQLRNPIPKDQEEFLLMLCERSELWRNPHLFIPVPLSWLQSSEELALLILNLDSKPHSKSTYFAKFAISSYLTHDDITYECGGAWNWNMLPEYLNAATWMFAVKRAASLNKTKPLQWLLTHFPEDCHEDVVDHINLCIYSSMTNHHFHVTELLIQHIPLQHRVKLIKSLLPLSSLSSLNILNIILTKWPASSIPTRLNIRLIDALLSNHWPHHGSHTLYLLFAAIDHHKVNEKPNVISSSTISLHEELELLRLWSRILEHCIQHNSPESMKPFIQFLRRWLLISPVPILSKIIVSFIREGWEDLFETMLIMIRSECRNEKASDATAKNYHDDNTMLCDVKNQCLILFSKSLFDMHEYLACNAFEIFQATWNVQTLGKSTLYHCLYASLIYGHIKLFQAVERLGFRLDEDQNLLRFYIPYILDYFSGKNSRSNRSSSIVIEEKQSHKKAKTRDRYIETEQSSNSSIASSRISDTMDIQFSDLPNTQSLNKINEYVYKIPFVDEHGITLVSDADLVTALLTLATCSSIQYPVQFAQVIEIFTTLMYIQGPHPRNLLSKVLSQTDDALFIIDRLVDSLSKSLPSATPISFLATLIEIGYTASSLCVIAIHHYASLTCTSCSIPLPTHSPTLLVDAWVHGYSTIDKLIQLSSAPDIVELLFRIARNDFPTPTGPIFPSWACHSISDIHSYAIQTAIDVLINHHQYTYPDNFALDPISTLLCEVLIAGVKSGACEDVNLFENLCRGIAGLIGIKGLWNVVRECQEEEVYFVNDVFLGVVESVLQRFQRNVKLWSCNVKESLGMSVTFADDNAD